MQKTVKRQEIQLGIMHPFHAVEALLGCIHEMCRGEYTIQHIHKQPGKKNSLEFADDIS